MTKTHLLSATLLAATLGLTACGGDGSSNRTFAFDVEVQNLTNNQPLSPPAVVMHNKNFELFDEGKEASVAMEHMAEGGSNTQIIESLTGNDDVLVSSGADAPIGPGASASYSLSFRARNLDDAYATVVTMLVNTNDAFTGEKNISLAGLDVNESITMRGPVWDAGTEANSETAGSIPGPATNGQGEGFNADRDDIVDVVVFHTGVVTQDDGLDTSVLNQFHRFDQPASTVKITRVR